MRRQILVRGWFWTAAATAALLLVGGGASAKPQPQGDEQIGKPLGTQTQPNDKAGGTMDNFGSAQNATPAAVAGKPAAMNEDAQVVAKLHHVNQMEITAGKLAQDQGQMKSVRDFGARLVRDHQAADKKLMAYADKNGIDANAMPPAGDDQEAKDQEHMDRLRNLSGAAFDHEFAMVMHDGHAKTIEMVTTARGAVTDPALRTMLGQLLPTLQKHDQTAQGLLSATQGVSSTPGEEGNRAQGRRPPATR
jgi:putative membrane protein